MFDRDKAVLVTGCSSGIGAAVARRFAEQGWTTYATARRVETLQDLERAGCRALPLDVTDEASMTRAVEQVEREHGAVAVLVNNAGYGQYGPVEQVPLAEVRRQFETNVFGLVRMCQLVLPGMRRRGFGRIVNVSSMGGRLTMPGGGVYHASKYAVEALSDALRFETAGFGVRVVLVEPGPVLTPWVETAVGSTGSASDPAGDADPYAEFNSALADRVAGAYRGWQGRLAATTAERVAEVVERAAASSRPRARYLVGPAAHALVRTRQVLPDSVFDAFLRTTFPRPRV